MPLNKKANPPCVQVLKLFIYESFIINVGLAIFKLCLAQG